MSDTTSTTEETQADVEAEAPATTALPTADGGMVHRIDMEGTQIDPSDGVRKPVEQIDRGEVPNFPLTPTGQEGQGVFVDTRTTQIGPDGLRHPIDDDPTPHPTQRQGG